MSPIEQVLATAKSLVNAGKIPSLALIKSKLGKQLPMPVLIQGLQRFKAMSSEEIEAISLTQTQPESPSLAETAPATLKQLQLQVEQLLKQQQALLERVVTLEAKLDQRDSQ